MADRPRVGVVGVGSIGRHHARIYAADPGVELVGLFDAEAPRAAAVAERHGSRASSSLDELLEAADAVSVAVPTLDHEAVALRAFEAGCDVLLEKPIAHDLAAADRILAAAGASGCLLQVGHVERFNPAVEVLLARISRPGFIEAHRLGSFVPRSLEVDVVIDLMIHDIDLLHALVPGPIVEIRAAGVPVLSDEVDIANARLEMADGCIVNLTASRVSMSRVRKLRVFQPEAYFSVDYAEQSLTHFCLEKDDDGRPGIQAVPAGVERAEPLVRELAAFAEAVRQRTPPPVDGAAGRRALETALLIRDALRRPVT